MAPSLRCTDGAGLVEDSADEDIGRKVSQLTVVDRIKFVGRVTDSGIGETFMRITAWRLPSVPASQDATDCSQGQPGGEDDNNEGAHHRASPITLVDSLEIGDGHVQWQRTALGLRGSVSVQCQGPWVAEGGEER